MKSRSLHAESYGGTRGTADHPVCALMTENIFADVERNSIAVIVSFILKNNNAFAYERELCYLRLPFCYMSCINSAAGNNVTIILRIRFIPLVSIDEPAKHGPRFIEGQNYPQVP